MVSKAGLALKFLLATSPVLRQLEKVNHPLLAFVFHLPECGSTYAGLGDVILPQQYFGKKSTKKANEELTPKRALKSRHIWWDVVPKREQSKTVD